MVPMVLVPQNSHGLHINKVEDGELMAGKRVSLQCHRINKKAHENSLTGLKVITASRTETL
jgi:hypothetical protein